MEYVLKPVEGTFHVTKEQGRIYVLTEGDFDYEEALEALNGYLESRISVRL